MGGGMPHIKILQYKKKKEGHKGEEWGEMKAEVREKIGEGHRRCASPRWIKTFTSHKERQSKIKKKKCGEAAHL